MRDWRLTAADPLALELAAETRLFQTDYTDDQIWRLVLGAGESPALTLETRYGGRCGLARLVPMWVVDGRVVYEAAAYQDAPVLRAFYPGYFRLTARPVDGMAVQVEYWAMTSHVVGGRLTIRNERDTLLEAGVDLIAQLMTSQRPGQINILTLNNDQYALQMKDVGNLQPVLMMHAVAASSGDRPRLSARVTVPPGEQTAIRWVQASRPDVNESLLLAHHWLSKENWIPHLQRLRDLNADTPQIETGDPARDAAIAFSYQTLLNSFVGPGAALPHPSFVLSRTPPHGFSQRGDGGDHFRLWAGQTVAEAYAVLSGVVTAAPEQAKDVIRNYLASAGPDGALDAGPGMAGQRKGVLAPPLLATLAWLIYGYSGDRAFLQEVFPGLLAHFECWFQPDRDHDNDGLPEWQTAEQTGSHAHPTFALFHRKAQNVDITVAESPDLAAYLLRDGRSLRRMADLLKDKRALAALDDRLGGLVDHLDALWRTENQRFQYRDRDSHISAAGVAIVEGDGDQELIPSLELAPPNRVLVHVQGGRDHYPDFSVQLDGLDADGDVISETLPREAFAWHRNIGTAISREAYARLDRVTASGLSRVYTVRVDSVDWTRQDQTLLIPLLAGLASERSAMLVQALTDPAQYWREGGIAAVPADAGDYDPAGQQGFGGVDPLFNLLLGEGLLEVGEDGAAADLLVRLLDDVTRALTEHKHVFERYNSDTGDGIGEAGQVTGVVPLHLLWRLMGFRVLSDRQVYIGGKYVLPWPVKVTHHGVAVERNADGAKITFPSGTVRRVRSARWRMVEDEAAPAAGKRPTRTPPGPPPGPAPVKRSSKTVRLKVQGQD